MPIGKAFVVTNCELYNKFITSYALSVCSETTIHSAILTLNFDDHNSSILQRPSLICYMAKLQPKIT